MIAQLLNKGHSKPLTETIIRAVKDDPALFSDLMVFVLGNDRELQRRAVWALSYLVVDEPMRIKPYWPKVLKVLGTTGLHPAVYRNFFRFMQDIPIPERFTAKVFDLALQFIRNPAQAIAIRAFALTTAVRICKQYPELRHELDLLLPELKELQSGAMIVRLREAEGH